MVIEGSFYRITPINEHSTLFDLELLYDIKGKNPRQEFKLVGYGMPLMTCLRKITAYSISKKYNDETLTLNHYVKEITEAYQKLRSEITECL